MALTPLVYCEVFQAFHLFFWSGSRNIFIYIYLYLFTFISERFVLFCTIVIFQVYVHVGHIAKPWLALACLVFA